MRCVDFAGYIASALVFLTFYMRGMIPLRFVAICSNVAFLIYACNLHLLPIMILHSALIPVNLYRLVAAHRDGAANPDIVRDGGPPLVTHAFGQAAETSHSRFEIFRQTFSSARILRTPPKVAADRN